MELWIYNKSLIRVGVVDDYKSLIWSKRYNELGDCEVYIAANKQTIKIFRKGYYIVRSDDDEMICRIEGIEIDTDSEQGNYLIVTGYDCKKIMNQRIVWTQTNFKGTVENFIRKIITDNIINPTLAKRKIKNFRLAASKGFTETLEIQSTYDYIFDKIKELSTTYGYGSRVTFDESNFTFELYKGVDRSLGQFENEVVIFSPEFENLITTKYKSDSTNIKTAALVAGEGEGLERIVEEIDEGTDINRYELYVDAKDVSPEISYEDLITKYPNGTIVEDNAIVYYVVNGTRIAILNHIDNPTSGTLLGEPYQVLLHQKGLEQLAEYTTTTTFDGEVEPNYSYKYGEDYFLGDIVTVKNEYGITANARITEVIENHDENGYSIIPTFEYIENTSGNALLTEDDDVITTEDGDALEYEY